MRKWVLPNSSAAIQGILYFSKDVPLALACVLSLRKPRYAAVFSPLKDLLSLGTVLFVGGSLISLHGMSPVGAIVSIRNVLFLPWVAFIVGRNLSGKSDISLICHTIGACAVVNSIVGGMQFYLPPSHWLNMQTNEMIDVVGAVGRVRASGTFSFLNAMGDLCSISCWAGAVMIGARPASWYGYITVGAGLTCGAEAMSRGAVLTGMILLALVAAVNPRGRNAAVVLALVGLLVYLGQSQFGTDDADTGDDPGLYSAIWQRHRSADDSIVGRTVGALVGALPGAIADVPLGVGLGRGQPSGQSAAPGMAKQADYEGEPGRSVYEIGLIGFLGVYLIRLGFPFLLWQYKPRGHQLDLAELMSVWWPTIWLMAMGVNFLIMFNHFQATYQAIAAICALGAAQQLAARRQRQPTLAR
ncbi:MAG: hypothetical protein C0467_13705 [Planctomycetaceae bacterium]|nr:hypothetical protein [Planctomycetaceae bacterium]